MSISGFDAQEALLKLKRSAETEIPGKKLNFTGPFIFKSRPVEALTELESNFVSWTGSTVEAAYQAPNINRRMIPPKALMMILIDLLIVS
ncbi:MAG: hypothetical protein B7Y67_15875 [Polynucleobacter sp. 35-46-11]|nr:MAG: hypothetical protein B7Y67_15875 [Polynucleobacter sp. 35-46-11]